MRRSSVLLRITGEFLVIVLGVLAALTAERWRETLGDAELRDQYLENLIADVRADVEAFQSIANANIPLRGEMILSAARGQDPHPDSVPLFIYSIEAFQWYNPPVVTRETYDDLISTGNQRLLRPRLRRALAQYYDRIRTYENREELFAGILVNGYRRVPSMVLGPELHTGVFDRLQERRAQGLPEVPEDWSIDPAIVAEVLNRLRGLEDLEAWVAERLYVDRQQKELYGDRLFRHATDLLRILEGVRAGRLPPDSIAFRPEALRN